MNMYDYAKNYKRDNIDGSQLIRGYLFRMGRELCIRPIRIGMGQMLCAVEHQKQRLSSPAHQSYIRKFEEIRKSLMSVDQSLI